MIIVAIDPGLTGAIAFHDTDVPNRVAVFDMPVIDGEVDVHGLFNIVTTWSPDIAWIEQVGPMPRDGVKQAWRFSGAYHSAKSVLALARISTRLVTPATWKRAMKVAGGPAGKEECRALATRLFPLNAAVFSRKKDQGRAEAALLALYASNITKGHTND